MEATLQTVERLIEGINGEDPAGACMYMSQLRENETLAMLECFEDMLSGKLPALNSSAPGDHPRGSSTSMAYRVPPSEFLKVLLEGSTTRLGALHAVLQATGRGDLQGRAASLCISEVRMCLAASSGDERADPCGDSVRSGQTADRRIPLGHLRELAGVCLSYSIDFSSAFGSAAAGAAYRGSHGRGDAVRERARGGEATNNRRILMLDALPAVLGACYAAAAADEEADHSTAGISECDSSDCGDGYQAAFLGLQQADGGGDRDRDERSSAAKKLEKKKGKYRGEQCDLVGFEIYSRRRAHHRGERTVAFGRGGLRGLPERGEALLSEVIDTILGRPWPPELALPLLVMFEEIRPLVEVLGSQRSDEDQVWMRVRSRLMECVWMGGLDGADFTGILRQVCIMCQTDYRPRYEQDIRRHLSSTPQPPEDSTLDALDYVEGAKGAETSGKLSREGGTTAKQVDGTCGSRSWLACLRQLHAAVPPQWLSTAELVLEQILHQMPDVADSLLGAIRDASSRKPVEVPDRERRPRESRSLGPGPEDPTTSIDDDLGLLLLLLREASPLRACSLPLLPHGVDRGRRAEESLRIVLLLGARRGVGPGANREASGRQGREEALSEVRRLLRRVLCSRRAVIFRTGGRLASGACSSSDGSGAGGVWSGQEYGGVASERASQLLELALRWLEESEGGVGSGCNGVASSGYFGGGGRDTADLTAEDLASETISAVFDIVADARPRLLRALLGGVFDQSQGGATCAPSYLRAWEALMAQEAQQQCRRLTPYSQVFSDALGRLTLIPRARARRVVESMLPLADACPAHASALMSLCRKCAARGENKGRLLALHAVACILVWNARRLRRGGCGGCLDQEGMREDLVAMFRKALEGGLQTATRADTLHLLASKVAVPAPAEMPRAATVAGKTTATAPRRALDAEPPPAVDFSVLRGLRELLTTRLFRFFAHKDELLDSKSTSGAFSSVIDNLGGRADEGSCPGDDGGGFTGGRYRGKGKQRAARRRRRAGNFRLVPLRLLDDGAPSDLGLGRGPHDARSIRGRGRVVPRDAIGHLLKCCWALVPQSENSFDAAATAGSGHGRVVVGPGKRAEAVAIARAILGVTVGGVCEGRGESVGGGSGVRTREGEALVAVVEFLEGGGSMETIRLIAPSGPRAPVRLEGFDNYGSGELPPPSPPPACHPGLVGSLPALAVVMTLAEALVDCLLSGVSCPPARPFLRPTPRYATTLGIAADGQKASNDGGGGRIAPRSGSDGTLVLWAVADVFTVLAAAARAAEGFAGTGGLGSAGWQPPKGRSPETLSEIVVSLPAEILSLSRRSDFDPSAAGATAKDHDELEDGAGGGVADAVQVQCPLLSASSALVLAKDFLLWAAAERGSPARAVAEGWDGGVGVWLGLTHSVRALAAALEIARVRGEETEDDTEEGREDDECFASIGRWEAHDGSPSSEAIALAVFELRAIVGTPFAALCVLDPTPSMRANSGESTTRYDLSAPATARPSSRRPPPGSMVTGFLKRMSERWKTHLDWGIPGAAPPRRTSARLGRGDGRDIRHNEGYLAYRRGDYAAQNLRAESEDSFFALRYELLRAERLALSTLLVGPSADAATRRWATRAALLSAQRESSHKESGGGGAVPPRECFSPTPAPAERLRGERGAPAEGQKHSGGVGSEPEAGSGPGLVGRKSKRGKVRRSRRHASMGDETRDSAGKAGSAAPRRDSKEGKSCLGTGTSNGDSGLRGCEKVPGSFRQATGCESVEKDEWEAVGRLCRLVALEMREGLENGLTVKLTQAYLDLVELLGNAALEHRYPTERAPARAAVGDAAPSIAAYKGLVERADDHKWPGDEDAGGVLLSITTCHCIGQVTLFKRLLRGAVRFDGVGAVRGHFGQHMSGVATVIELEARNREISRDRTFGETGGGFDKTGGGVDEPTSDASAPVAEPAVAAKGEAVVGRAAARSPLRRAPKRCCRMLVHCIRWVQVRNGGRNDCDGSTALPGVEKNGRESNEETGVGENPAGFHDLCNDNGSRDEDVGCGKKRHDRPSHGFWGVAEVYDDENDNDEEASDGSGRGAGADTGDRYSFCPDDVKFATSRECYAAMHVTLLEIETVLIAAGSLEGGAGEGVDSNAATAPGTHDADLANMVMAVSHGLRKFFKPIETASTRRPPSNTKTNQASETAAAPPESATSATTTAVAVTASPGQGRKRKKHGASGDKKKRKPPVPADLVPEHIKLLLMRVLGRVYRVGRACALNAAGVLLKSPPAAALTSLRSSQLPPATTSPPPPLAPATSSKRRRQSRASENISRPGDQAGGGPATRGKVVADADASSDNKRGLQQITTRRRASTVCPSSPLSGAPASDSPVGAGNKFLKRSRNAPGGETEALKTPRSRIVEMSTMATTTNAAVSDEHQESHLLLATLLPAVAISSGDCLRLMAEARAWAEARRAQSRRQGDDPCRKRASTLLFKMDRCELEIGRAAQGARHYLDNFRDFSATESGHKSTHAASAPGVNTKTNRGGVRSAKKRARGSGGSGNSGLARVARRVTKCNDTIERALRLLLSGADTLAAWRRESSAQETSVRGNRRKNYGSRGGKRQKDREGDDAETGFNTPAGGDAEEERKERYRNAERGFAGSALGVRRRSARSRVRSRNPWIDGWLAEGGEEGGDRGDAFVDLEDFIEA